MPMIPESSHGRVSAYKVYLSALEAFEKSHYMSGYKIQIFGIHHSVELKNTGFKITVSK